MIQSLETKTVYNNQAKAAEYAIIWLHGLGADYNDFLPVVDELKLNKNVKFIFPNAPIIPVTINNGFKMRAWYDILDFSDLHRKADDNGIVQSTQQINQIITSLNNDGFANDKIIMAGFSQGGVISYYTALNSAKPLAGLLVLSSYLPNQDLLNKTAMANNAQLPILICHGTADPVVSINYAKKACEILDLAQIKYQWQTYPMQHSLCMEEINDIATWLNSIFANN